MRQKSRSKWIKEGDGNTSYFHKIINFSRRRNALRGLHIEGSWVDKPAVVKAAILQHFQGRFAEPSLNRPNLDGVSFNVLSSNQRDMMGFHERWIRWIKGCLSSASISILVNGTPTKEFLSFIVCRSGEWTISTDSNAESRTSKFFFFPTFAYMSFS